MVALKYLLGQEIETDLFKCWFCEKQYNVKNGVAALRRHHEAKHEYQLQGILRQMGPDLKPPVINYQNFRGGGLVPPLMEQLDQDIKMEPQDEDFNTFPNNFLEGTSDAPPHSSDNVAAANEMAENGEEKPQVLWFPSSKGRSIVWEHINWVQESQRAACIYCNAEFQIKGGTSALLRHLKTIHPAAINFDPENPPPIVRRKKRKMNMEDYTIVTEDTKSYMDNLLDQFLTEDGVPRGSHPEQSASPSPVPPTTLAGVLNEHLTPPPMHHHSHHHPQQQSQPQQQQPQNRADSEIDEVIRNLHKETAQNEQEPDQDLRKLLGIGDEQVEEVIAISGSAVAPTGDHSIVLPDEEKQVASSSSGGKKRKAEEPKPIDFPGLASGKFPLSMLSSIRRPPPTMTSSTSTAPPVVVPFPAAPVGQGIPAKYNQQAVQCLDFEAKVLYNQSLHSTIALEDAMTSYYRMKTRKMELEVKMMEKQQGLEDHDDPEE